MDGNPTTTVFIQKSQALNKQILSALQYLQMFRVKPNDKASGTYETKFEMVTELTHTKPFTWYGLVLAKHIPR